MRGNVCRKTVGSLVVSAVLALAPSTANAANLLLNAGFESVTGTGSTADFANWNESGPYELSTNAHAGSYSVRLGPGPGNTSIVSSPKLTLPAGEYEFGAWFQYSANAIPLPGNYDKGGVTATFPPDYPYVAVQFESVPLAAWKPGPSGGYITDWFLIRGTFLLTNPVINFEVNVSFQDNTTTDGRITHAYADDAFLQPIPEPASLTLLGLGLAGLGARLRKRRS